ncbi:MAG: zinc-binding alcohol dehydrogenase [Lachnospiraceae bacterium]|nr:zinc-binding alcohol dehydrogenase [Lachnospiraceae bacterium]
MERVRLTSMEDGIVFLKKEDLEEPNDTQVTVEVKASVVSPGTERAFILTLENTDHNYPRVLGYSAAGVVVKVGKSVTDFKPGDRVAGIMPHANIHNVESRNLVHIPDGVSFEQAAFVRIGVISMQAVRKARLELGESTMVLGLGLIGQMAMQLAKANGAAPVIGLDIVESKRRLAEKLGCTYVYDSRQENIEETLKSVGNGKLPQVVIESTGFPKPIEQAIQLTEKYGRVIILGSTRGSTEINFYRDVHKKGIQIIGAHISCNPADVSYPGYWTFKDNADCFMRLLSEDRVHVEELISQQAGYRDYNEIYANVLQSKEDYITSVITW